MSIKNVERERWSIKYHDDVSFPVLSPNAYLSLCVELLLISPLIIPGRARSEKEQDIFIKTTLSNLSVQEKSGPV